MAASAKSLWRHSNKIQWINNQRRMQCAHVLLLSHWHWWGLSDAGQHSQCQQFWPAERLVAGPPPPSHTSPCHRHHYTFTCAGTLTFKSWYCISALFFDENKTKQNKLYRNDPRSVGFREQCVRHARAPVKGRVATYLICLAEKKKMRQKSLSFRDQSLLRSDQIATGIYIDVTV